MSSSSSNTGPLGTVTGVGASGAGACDGAGAGLSVGNVVWFTELFAATITGVGSGSVGVGRAWWLRKSAARLIPG